MFDEFGSSLKMMKWTEWKEYGVKSKEIFLCNVTATYKRYF